MSSRPVLRGQRPWHVWKLRVQELGDLWTDLSQGGSSPQLTKNLSRSCSAPALRAQMTAAEALDYLLSGTGMGHEFLNESTVLIEVPGAGGLPLLSAGDSDDAVTPRAVLAWHPTNASTLYASYAQGFRSGLVQSPDTLSSPLFSGSGLGSVKPDTLTNYEIGAKTTLFDGRLSLGTAVYYMDWRDIKTSFLVSTPAGLIAGLVNGPSASGAGVDMTIAYRPINGIEIGGSGSWNDLTMDEQVRSGTAVVYNKGDRLAQSSETTASGFVEFSFPLGS